ncbi:hypothetical protein BJF79_43505 [Actinomadura sp. CNU-125]|uniref:hypothetical protein n=1 Tax=Actinomadura sp. CNU-125 TaxID=1904961 RepID=UPI00095EDF69|nr:hypothetical protein [Actinomadura sp. CNU-125]OLT26411.1 hypothetical protein BJF79_43505 [Actinomadura sp. CNU-125]
MASGSLARTARGAVRGAAAERPLPVRVLVLVLLLLAVAASVCLKPVHGAAADAAPPVSGARVVQASATASANAPDAPDDDRYCSKQKTTQGQNAPNVAHEAPSTLVPATLAPPPNVPAAEPVRYENGPSPPEPRHILLSVLRI